MEIINTPLAADFAYVATRYDGTEFIVYERDMLCAVLCANNYYGSEILKIRQKADNE